MRTLKEATEKLKDLFDAARKATEDRKSRLEKYPDWQDDDLVDAATKYIRDLEGRIDRCLADLLRYPPHHRRHFEKLKEWHGGEPTSPSAEHPYNKCVFLMTKYPSSTTEARDVELANVIECVKDALKAAGFRPRIASEKDYHPMLWDNVELFMLGCFSRIAIVEDCCADELNPNLAMEWGWMRAMGKPVLYLVEETFNHQRADVEGFLSHRFKWATPKDSIPEHVTNWLQGLGGT